MNEMYLIVFVTLKINKQQKKTVGFLYVSKMLNWHVYMKYEFNTFNICSIAITIFIIIT